MAQLYRELQPKSWQELKDWFWALSVGGWVFRGQRDAAWDVSSSLERSIPASLRNSTDEKIKDLIGDFLEAAEGPVFNKFTGRLDQYVGSEEGTDSILGKLALMQHHGVPTRLIDFTKSPYVATFFAVEDALDPEGQCAVWVISVDWCQAKSVEAVRKKNKITEKDFPDNADFSLDDILNETVFKSNIPLVAPLLPLKLNARIASQQGLFLCPGEMSMTFMENLLALGKNDLPNILYKIVFPAGWRATILFDLNSMNIGPHTLFPGLDGFAKSIKLELSWATEYDLIEEEILAYAKQLGL
jgi:hypothetical protein